MLGYSHGIAERGSEYGNAGPDEEFWRFQFVLIVEFASILLDQTPEIVVTVTIQVRP